jgi:hypothetical protein
MNVVRIAARGLHDLLRAGAIGFVRGYQLIVSPWLGPRCRFHPSCSHYACEALQSHGLFGGSWLTLRRLARCHPFCAGGVDLVPPAPGQRSLEAAAPHRSCP